MSKRKQKSKAPEAPPLSDLVVLATDKDTYQVIEGLLVKRTPSLQIRPITHKIIGHPDHDPGCLNGSAPFLSVYLRTCRYALVVFDREGCGREKLTREELESAVEADLKRSGWEDRAAVIVVDPELENWVWNRSPHVEASLGWKEQTIGLREWLIEQSFLPDDAQPKPDRPKEAMQAVLAHLGKPWSASIFRALAEKVSFAHCEDPAFLKFLETLRKWFPHGRSSARTLP